MHLLEFTLRCPACRSSFQVRTKKRNARRARCPCGEVFNIELPSTGKPQLTFRKRATDPGTILTDLPAGEEQVDSASLLGAFAFVTIVGVVVSGLIWLLGFELLARIVFYVTIIVLMLLLLLVANLIVMETKSRLVISGAINREVISRATKWWIPLLLLLVPGITLTFTIDRLIDGAIQYAEVFTHSSLATGSDEFARRIVELEGRTYRKWWPPDYARQVFDGAILNVLRSTTGAIPRASLMLRTLFSFVYAVMRILQVLFFAWLFFLLLRSYLHILGRYWLWQIGDVRFRPVTN